MQFSVAKATLHSQMSVCLSVHYFVIKTHNIYSCRTKRDKGTTKHVSPENYSMEMDEYEKHLSSYIAVVPIVYKEVQNARGKCFYLNAKDKLSTLEPQIQGSTF